MTRPLTADQRIHREGTLEAYQHGVERSIQVMHDRLGDQLAVDELADAAFMSRFHFSRVFNEITGASPARFLAAIRMQEAKGLLLKTDRSVTDICFDCGYHSLGTFTRIFTELVGFSPARFRNLSRALIGMTIEDVVRLIPPILTSILEPPQASQVVCDESVVLVAVALFPTAIPRSYPIDCACLANSRQFSFVCQFPRKAWVFAAGVMQHSKMTDVLTDIASSCVVGAADARPTLSIQLRQASLIDPPLVVAFPLLLFLKFIGFEMSTLGEDESI